MKKILISSIVTLAIFFAGCSNEKKKSSAEIEQKNPLIEETTTPETSNEEQIESTTLETLNEEQIESTTLETLNEEQIESTTGLITENAEIPLALELPEEVIIEIQEDEVVKVMTVEEIGAELYVKCSACHGQKAEQSALGISEVIQGWDAQKIVLSLTKYKNEIYGGNLRAIMIGQVVTLSDEDINALAQHISGL